MNSPQYIRRLQQALNRELGLHLPPNGEMNFRTRRAIRSFQRQKGLPVTGIVQLATERALIVAINDAFESDEFTSSLDQEIPQPGQPQTNQAQYQDILVKIRGQLERRFRSANDPMLQQRRQELRRLFSLVPPAFAKELSIQLQNPADLLGSLLSSRLAPATRTEMLGLLQNKIAVVPTPSRGQVPPQQTGLRTAGPKCKQDWDKLLSSLPEDLRTALNDQDWNNAIVMAIHHGIRDLSTLTDLLFNAKYGKSRGYCRLTNGQADTKYIQYWNQDNSSIRGMMARPSPPLAQKSGIKCRKVERDLADPKWDNPKIDVTGRYENQFKYDGRTLTAWIVSINQAGRHIEGIITRVLYPDPRPQGWWSHPDDNPKDRPFTEIYGDLQANGSFLFFDKRNPSGNWGYFRFENGGLNWEVNGSRKSRLIAISKTPTLLNTSAFDKLVWLHEKFPLTQLQIKHLVNNLADHKVATYLQNYFTTPAGIRSFEKSALAQQARKLQLYIADVLTLEFNGVHDKDLELGQFYAKTILTNNKWKFKQITRSQLDWIQIILDVNRGNGFGLPAIEKYLGLRASKNIADPQAPQHEYKVTLKLTGGALILGGYLGKITVEKTNGQVWKESYKVHFLGGGIDVAFRDEMTGKATTYHEWLPPDIPGEIRLGELGIGIGVASASAGFMQIFGSGYLPPMDVGFADLDSGLKKPTLKAGGKAMPFGKIWNKDFPDFDATKSFAITDYAADYNLQGDVHFCLGSALLTEDARQALRIVCANELVAFLSPASTLEIIGHTDRVDTPDRNLTLSLLRSENTLQAIKDILGSNFKILEGRTRSSGSGENEAVKDNRPDDKPDPKYRRVDVILNSRLVISLKAQ